MTGRVRYAFLGVALTAAAPATLLSQIAPGLWEFSGPRNAPVRRVCLREPEVLARVEHQRRNCTQSIVRNDSITAIVDYTCPGAGFGNSKITMLTPRSMRIETQGISGEAPFAYVVQARRIGPCPAH
ncbi:hypothetical protein G7078_08500 [Sphingomonas sinipercae]|uniref:DUF3617 family protein n=1 Tax=Sphingomonas sinipercae TaxID=2714944 RepID=A0A6G7ZPF9_9SPHN|nr:DUF3617 family protein [Sphingomonas sinipercae]QIL02818.1 hypothetical protein G7078_08500 [Sphingomonas sinipercae]